MPRSKVTSKYQVTIPKEVREKVGVKTGEFVLVEALSPEEIRLKRFPSVSNPLRVLVGRKRYRRAVTIDELEQRIESR